MEWLVNLVFAAVVAVIIFLIGAYFLAYKIGETNGAIRVLRKLPDREIEFQTVIPWPIRWPAPFTYTPSNLAPPDDAGEEEVQYGLVKGKTKTKPPKKDFDDVIEQARKQNWTITQAVAYFKHNYPDRYAVLEDAESSLKSAARSRGHQWPGGKSRGEISKGG